MKVIFAYIIAFASLTALLAGPPGPHGWSQPRVETKASEIYYATNYFVDIYPYIEPKTFPIIVLLRTYAKTNKVESHESLEPNGVQWNLVLHPATTNLVTVHVLGYFSGTNAVELLEIEKPQAK